MDFYKKSLLFIFLLFILIFIPTIVNADYTFTYNNRNYTVPDFSVSYDYYVVYAEPYGNGVRLTVFESSIPINIYHISSSYYIGWQKNQPQPYVFYVQYVLTSASNPTWTMQAGASVNANDGYYYTTLNNSFSIIEANYVVYIYNNSNATNGDIYYSPPDNYEHYPYFMNTSEDIAIGGQDLIIMPR